MSCNEFLKLCTNDVGADLVMPSECMRQFILVTLLFQIFVTLRKLTCNFDYVTVDKLLVCVTSKVALIPISLTVYPPYLEEEDMREVNYDCTSYYCNKGLSYKIVTLIHRH